jgi:hypothetical protein
MAAPIAYVLVISLILKACASICTHITYVAFHSCIL